MHFPGNFPLRESSIKTASPLEDFSGPPSNVLPPRTGKLFAETEELPQFSSLNHIGESFKRLSRDKIMRNVLCIACLKIDAEELEEPVLLQKRSNLGEKLLELLNTPASNKSANEKLFEFTCSDFENSFVLVLNIGETGRKLNTKGRGEVDESKKYGTSAFWN